MRPFLLLPLALTLTLSAQETTTVTVNPPPPTKPAPIPRGRITGTVICADTRAPARGATVLLSTPPVKPEQNNAPSIQRTTHVSLNGTYAFDHVPPGEYAVVAFLQGYLSVVDDLPDDLTDPSTQPDILQIFTSRGIITVPPEGAATSDIVLERGAALSGRILYADGAPAGQLNVAAESANAADPKVPFQMNPRSFMKSMFTQSSNTTDDLGRFRLNGLKPGSYRIVVTQASTTSTDDRGGDGMDMFAGMVADPRGLHFYSGDTFHKKAAKAYDLRAGDEIAGIDIRLPIDGLHTVRGLLIAADGRPITTAQLTLTDTSDPSFAFLANPDQEGAFRFNSVPPGTYTLASSNALITLPAGSAPQSATSNNPPATTFADASTPIIVKDSDLTAVPFTLTAAPAAKP